MNQTKYLCNYVLQNLSTVLNQKYNLEVVADINNSENTQLLFD